MTATAPPADPLAKARYVDEVCDRFEAAWKAFAHGGPRPALADFLTDSDPDLIHELLPIEAHYLDRYLPHPTPFPITNDTTIPFTDDTTTEPLPPAPPGIQLLGVLARGGMGIVYRATQPLLQREVAYKVMRDGALASPDQRTRFLTEAETLAAINHPGIVQVYQYGVCAGSPYLALELCRGGTLADTLARGPLNAQHAATMVERIALAVQAAHEHGIIHRDLKPSNILLTHDGQPKVTDFGLAHRHDGPALTVTGDVLGTPAYMAPEQAAGQKVNASADVYALGAILYECLAGRPPFVGDSPGHILNQVLHDEPTPLTRLIPRVPRDLATIVQRCLQKEPLTRYVSAAAVAADLLAFLEGRPIAAKRVSNAERLWKWTRRNPWLAGLAAGIIVVLLAGSGFSSYFAMQANRRANDATKAKDKETDAKNKEIDAKNDAVAQAKVARSAAVRMFHERGYQAYRANDGPEGLLWNIHALTMLDPENTAKQTELERHAQAWLQYALPLKQVIPYGGPIHTVALSPDGSRMALGGARGKVLLVATDTGATLHTLDLPGPALIARFTTDGRQLLTAGAEHGVCLWEVATGKPLFAPLKPEGTLTEILVHPEGKLCCLVGQRMPLTYVQLADWTPLPKTPTAKSLDVVASGLSADGRKIGVALASGEVQIIEWLTGNQAHPAFRTNTIALSALAFTPNGTFLVLGDRQGGFSSWLLDGQDPRWGTVGSLGHIRQIVPNAQGQVVCASESGSCHIYEQDGRAWPMRLGSGAAVRSVAVDRAGHWVLAGGDDGFARLWQSRPAAWHETTIPTSAASLNDGRIVLSTAKGTYPLANPERVLPTGPASVNAISPDGERLFVVNADNNTQMWNVRTGKSLGKKSFCPFTPSRAKFSSDGKYVVISGNYAPVYAFDGFTGALWAVIDPKPPSNQGIKNVVWGRDNETLFLSGRGGQLRRWRVEPGRLHADAFDPKPGAQVADMASNGTTVAVPLTSNEVHLFDMDGKPTGPTLVHPRIVYSTRFSPDGKTLLVGGEGGMLHYWDVAQRSLVGRPWEGHTVNVFSLSIAPSGQLAASGDILGFLRFWDVGTGLQIGPALKHNTTPLLLQFMSNEEVLFTHTRGVARLIPVPQPTAIDVQRLKLWLAVHYGTEVSTTHDVVQLTPARWYERWQEWQRLGGTLLK